MYVLTLEVVRAAVRDLAGRRIHPNIIAYLHLRERAVTAGRFTDIEPDWSTVSELMRVPSTLMTKPLFRPFAAHTVKDPSKYWVEDHPVGSYGVASLRGTSRSLLLDSSGSRFELAEGHASEALKLLLGGNRLPAWSFAAYCLRNYGFDSPHWSDAYGMSILIRGLRSVFRLDDPDGDFAMLFDEAPPSKDFAAWFEAFVPDTADGE